MVTISEVLGNGQKLDGGAMFGNAPRALWEKWEKPDELGRIDLACRALLIKIDGKNILCETGIGAFFEPKLAERFGVQNSNKHMLLENLKKLNLTDADIDYVILSHLHFDHAGGLLPTYYEMASGDDSLLFKNAQYIVGKESLERARNPHFRDKASFIPGLVEKLEQSGRLQIVEGNKLDGLDRIEFIYSHGHTPGQMHTLFAGDNKKVFFAGDLIPGSHWVNLPITMGYDRYPEMLIDEKQELYNRAVKEEWLVYYTHDNQFSCSTIAKNEKGKYQAVNPFTNPVDLEV